jgi:hypothetical protein
MISFFASILQNLRQTNNFKHMIFIYFFLFTFIACTLRLHFYFGGAKLSFIDRLLVTNPIILNILFLFASLIFIFIISPICGLDAIYPMVGLDFSALPNDDLISHMVDKDSTGSPINIGENATVNINNGKVSVSVDTRVAAAVSAGAGAGAGIQVAKYVAGPPAVKIAAGVATAGAVQLTTTFMSKVLNSNNNNAGASSKLVANLIQSSRACLSSGSGNNVLNDYPLNLLFEINGFLICGLVFLYIILNIYITKYIISAKADLVKYIPASIKNHKIGKYLDL